MIDENKEPHKNITQDDVARRAGVSRSIVSYVINNGPRSVSDETRQRVLQAIQELGYRPNKHAQMLSGNEGSIADKYIGIIIAGDFMFKRPYYGIILAGIHEQAHVRDYHIRFIRVFNDFNNPMLFNELIHPNEISGVILIGLNQVVHTAEDHSLVEEIVRRVERVVCVEWEWPGVPSVGFDRQNAAYQATQHLLETGRGKIAYLGPDDERIIGYQQALWEHSITPDKGLIDGGFSAQFGYESCERLMAQYPTVDGICAGSDEVAIGVLNFLHRNEVAVPEMVAVASIDNIDISAYTIPSLTTVDVPKFEIGFHAVETLIDDKAHKGSSAFVITVRTELIVRESSITIK
jgi:DNA-binding LacI/PurR family transcriptional regulator